MKGDSALGKRLAYAVLGILIAACTTQTVETSTTGADEPTVTPDEGGWLPQSAGPPVTSMSALLPGELHIDTVDRCVTVHQSETELTFVVVWVDGTRLDLTDPAAPVLVLPHGERLEDGESVELGGGSWGADPDFARREPAYREVEITGTCQADAVWIAAPSDN